MLVASAVTAAAEAEKVVAFKKLSPHVLVEFSGRSERDDCKATRSLSYRPDFIARQH